MTLLLLLSCADPDGECGEIITVTASATYDDAGEDVYVNEPCYEKDPADGSHLDVSDCCPEGYAFLAMGDSSTVLCEEECE